MANFMQKDTVRYACTCGILKPPAFMYFCRHCVKLRCGYCVAHEVDSHYCSHCLELLPSSEARLKRNRCATCFDCPSCFNSLNVRATTVSTRDPDDPNKAGTPRKMYYQACSLCRWTSRDVGLPDQPGATVVSSNWPQRETSNSIRVGVLIDQARTLSILDRLEREQKDKKFAPRTRRSFMHLSGLTSAQARKRAGLPPELPAASTVQDSLKGFVPAVAKKEVEQLPDDIFTKHLDLNMVTTLPQRLAQPEHQPISVMDVIPVHKHLSIKRSQRCRECEHSVSKPEMNPCSIRFKILHATVFNTPCVSLIKWDHLEVGKESEIWIMLVNPTRHHTIISFLPHDTPEPEDVIIKTEDATNEEIQVPQELDTGSQGPLSSMPRMINVLEEPRPVNVSLNAEVKFPPPDSTITIPPEEYAADYDESGDTQEFQDDPKLVLWRRANKAAIRLTVVPNEDSATEDLSIGFVLKFSYMDRIAPNGKEPQKLFPQVRVYVKAGKISGVHAT